MQSNTENPAKPGLTFGFDIGIASVGWAVLSTNRIVNLGVRAFDRAETAKEGHPLNLARRQARLTRNRLNHRAIRLRKLAKLLIKYKLIIDPQFFHPINPATRSLWELRVEAIDRMLDKEAWARVIYHLHKHRGFYWYSKAEAAKAEGDNKSEGGRVKQGLAKTEGLLKDHSYRTVAEMVLKEFPQAQRNKHGDYGKALSRVLLADELKLLFERQRQLGNEFASTELELELLGPEDKRTGLFWEQKPALSGTSLLNMLGHCTFEKEELRAPKASFTAERHVWLTRLNNLRISIAGEMRPLTATERVIALPLPYAKEKFTYKQLRTALERAGLATEFRFMGLAYPASTADQAKAKDPETEILAKLPGWHELRLKFSRKGLEQEWQQISLPALEGNPEILDRISWILSVYKEDDEARAELHKLDLPNAETVVDALLEVRFDKFHSLSLKALHCIVPLMESGKRYDEACAEAGYNHSQPIDPSARARRPLLPPLYTGRNSKGSMEFNKDLDPPRNPVVLRALNQARKVLNALVKEYGAPDNVHIELARDLSNPLDERQRIKREQEKFRDNNQKSKDEFREIFGSEPNARDFEKWLLYREQQGKCGYSLETLLLERLFEPGYAEVDHSLPYSRSFDDSKNNKVLALSRCNRDKGNRTPYEYLDGAGTSERWRLFAAFVGGNKNYRQAKRNKLLRKNFDAKEAESFKERNLNDTRYIARFFKNYVEQYLQLSDTSDHKRCVVLSGQLTSFLRARWGLTKSRDESDRHHAQDAVVIAACSHGLVKRLSDYSRRKLLDKVRDGFVDIETGEIVNRAMLDQLEIHFPEPWENFRQELLVRLNQDNPESLKLSLSALGTYSEADLALVKPLFVSRAPRRRIGGAAHKETIYSQPPHLKAENKATEKVMLKDLKLSDFQNLVEPHRNERLYQALKMRLEQFDGKADKAFTPGNPFYKPGKNGGSIGPVVHSVTRVIDKISGIPIRGGIARNDSMIRVDIFTKGKKFYLVPIYVHHKVMAKLPNKAVVAYKDENEWDVLDESFDFLYSIYPNDLVKIQLKRESFLGYYAGLDRSTGAIHLWAHDRNKSVGKDGMIRSVGVKTALNLEKLHVDILGNIHRAGPELRYGLA